MARRCLGKWKKCFGVLLEEVEEVEEFEGQMSWDEEREAMLFPLRWLCV